VLLRITDLETAKASNTSAIQSIRNDLDTLIRAVSQLTTAAATSGATAGATTANLNLNLDPDAVPSAVLPPGVKAPQPTRLDGRRKDNVPRWIAQTLSILKISGFNPDSPQAIAYAATFLDGPAAAWWSTRQAGLPAAAKDYGGFSTYAEFGNELEIGIGIYDKQAKARNKLDNLKQTTSVLAYGEAFNQCLTDLPERHWQDVRHDYLRGLKKQIREMIIGKISPDDRWPAIHKIAHECDELLMSNRHAGSNFVSTHRRAGAPAAPALPRSEAVPMDLDIVSAQPNNSGSRSSTPGRRRPSSPHPGSFTQRLAPLTEAERDYLRKNNGCFKCRKLGHYQSSCPRNSPSRSGKPGTAAFKSPSSQRKN
jgi:hypothetical protein